VRNVEKYNHVLDSPVRDVQFYIHTSTTKMRQYLLQQWVALVPRYLGIVQWKIAMGPHGPNSRLREAVRQRDRCYSRLVVANGSLPWHDWPNRYGASLTVHLEQKRSR